jgi:hypothetical protein
LKKIISTVNPVLNINFNVGGEEVYKCKDGSDPNVHLTVIPGVIGAPSSVTSMQVATLLKLFKIPQVYY